MCYIRSMMHRSQVLLWSAISFLAGVAIASFVDVSGSTLLIFVLIGASILLVSSYRGTFGESPRGIYWRKVGFLIGFLVLICAGGMYRFSAVSKSDSRLLEFADREAGGKGIPVKVTGYVDGEFDTSKTKGRFPFRVKAILPPGLIVLTNERILVEADQFQRYEYGTVLTLEGVLKTPQNFDTFDYITYLKKEGIRVIASQPRVTSGGEKFFRLGLLEKGRIPTYRVLLKVKHAFENSLARSLPEPHASFVAGILLGSRQGIPSDLQNAFARTSTSHVLAVSGYNVSVVASMVMAVLIAVMPRRKAFWVTLVFLMGFVIVTGGSASVVRATCMGALILFAQSYGRLSDAGRAVVLVAAIMVVINPFLLVFDVGFQLSFLAVVGLIYIGPLFQRWTSKLPLPKDLQRVLSETAAAQIAVLPLIIFYFKLLSIIGLPANLLIVPLIPLAMTLGFVTGLAGLIIPVAGKFFGLITWFLTSIQIRIVEYLSGLFWATLSISVSWYMLVLLYIGIVATVIVIRNKKPHDLTF